MSQPAPDGTAGRLAAALAPVAPEFAGYLNEPMTSVTVEPAPFLRSYHLYRVMHRSLYSPVLFFVGYSDGHPVHLLFEAPDEFVAMAHDDGVELSDPDEAVAYVRLLLESTRPMSVITYLVEAVDGIRYRPTLDDSEEERRQAVKARLSAEVGPPSASVTDSGFDVDVYVVHGLDLERRRYLTARDGSFSVEVTTLEEDLPLLIAG